MGIGIFASIFALALLFKPLGCQQPNTDEYFVLEFLTKMEFHIQNDHGFSGDFCSWRGVSCDEEGQYVVEFVGSGLGLSGGIPETTLGKLRYLQILDLSNNSITALPSDFWSLGSLTSLNLSHNRIAGGVSDNIGNFGSLRILDLSYNVLSGRITEAITSLHSLALLNLSHNQFESAVPLGILQCTSLESINLSENNLGGSLPKGFASAFPELKFLNLAGNAIAGRKSDLSGMKMIRYLNVSGNLFDGPVVGLFDAPLQVIDLSRNRFQGHIARVNFSWSSVVYLDLSENKLSGVFFTDLTNASNLKHLNLACNRFSQQLFLQVDGLASLEYLNLSETDLFGRIPSSISSLRNLRTLDLSNNDLRGRIPRLTTMSLTVLDLSNNNLTGDIPTALLGHLHRMSMYNFSYNNLSFCGSKFSPEARRESFIGSVDSCPIAANPAWFKRARKHRGLKIAVALSLSLFCLLVGLLVVAVSYRRKRSRTWAMKQISYRDEQSVSGPFSFQTDSTTWVADVKQATSVPVVIFEKPLLNFTFADLLAATSHFDRGTLLAEGRFGPVYGGLLPGGIHVAVKVLVHGSTLTDEEAAREFEQLGHIKHPNLVPLTGYCLAGEQRIAIYEYMDNGNLQNLLYDLPLADRSPEDWSADTWDDDGENGIQNVVSDGSQTAWRFRHKIALGTARALAFLHHGCSPPIIHRDIKASSVYLDSNLEPRLSDFGLAKIFGNGLDDEIVRGSPGYIAPEFLQPESSSPTTPTPKSDVYGFGVVLLELVTGKKPVEDSYLDEKEGSLVSWVRGLVRRNQALQAIDPKIRGTGPDRQMVEALKVGYLCTAETPAKRPSMQQVVGLLKDLEQIAV